MKAMILAAGRGQRMHPLTDATPKPLLKIGKYSLIEHHLFALAAAKINEIVINVSYFPEQFTQLLGDGKRYGVEIAYSFERYGLETGGGILHALPLLGEQPFIALSADLWTNYSFAQLPQHITGLAHLVMVDNPVHHLDGDFCLIENKIVADGDRKLNFAGIGVYHPRLFVNCKPGKFPLAPLLRDAMQKNLVSGEYFSGTWINIGTIDQLEELRQTQRLKV